MYCHSADPTRLRTPADEVPALLKSGAVRAHGRLKYSETEIESLLDYLRSARGAK